MEDPQKVLELTVQAGQLLLENGAEVFRVQQTMEIMAAAYGETEFHVYVLTNGIFASLGRDGRQHMARVGHVPQSSVHLGRVDAVNTLSRQIAAGQVPLEEAMARIEQIRAIPVLPLWQQVLACGAGTGFFTILFGGGWREFGCAFVAGILLQLFLWRPKGGVSTRSSPVCWERLWSRRWQRWGYGWDSAGMWTASSSAASCPWCRESPSPWPSGTFSIPIISPAPSGSWTL